ncbi:uncharacterized protein LOC144049383 isoform X2 [Vanacampus margaritifer]
MLQVALQTERGRMRMFGDANRRQQGKRVNNLQLTPASSDVRRNACTDRCPNFLIDQIAFPAILHHGIPAGLEVTHFISLSCVTRAGVEKSATGNSPRTLPGFLLHLP